MQVQNQRNRSILQRVYRPAPQSRVWQPRPAPAASQPSSMPHFAHCRSEKLVLRSGCVGQYFVPPGCQAGGGLVPFVLRRCCWDGHTRVGLALRLGVGMGQFPAVPRPEKAHGRDGVECDDGECDCGAVVCVKLRHCVGASGARTRQCLCVQKDRDCVHERLVA